MGAKSFRDPFGWELGWSEVEYNQDIDSELLQLMPSLPLLTEFHQEITIHQSKSLVVTYLCINQGMYHLVDTQ